MAYTYRKKIKISKSYEMTDSLKYISNAEKTVEGKVQNIEEDLEFNNLDDVLNYAENEGKTTIDGKQYCFSRNCHIPTAAQEIKELLQKYGHYEEGRNCLFHTVVSFAYTDPITPDEMVQFGNELLEKYYGNYMSVGFCHINEVKETHSGSQFHFHILTSATDLDGKRLKDDFFGKEGLLELRKVCDELCAKYNCQTMGDANNRFFRTTPKGKNVRSLNSSQKGQLIRAIDELKQFCSSTDDLLELLQLEYSAQVERSKDDVSITLPGFEKNRRLSSLGEGYSLKELNTYFYRKKKGYLTEADLKRLQALHDSELDDDTKAYSDMLLDTYQTVEPRLDKYKSYEQRKLYAELEKVMDEFALYEKLKISGQKEFKAALINMDQNLKKAQQEYEDQKKELTSTLETRNLLRNYLQLYPHSKDPKAYPEDAEYFKIISEAIKKVCDIEPDLPSVRSLYKESEKSIFELQKILAHNSEKQADLRILKRVQNRIIAKEKDNPLPTITFTDKNIMKTTKENLTFAIPYLKGLCAKVPTSSCRVNYGRYNYCICEGEELDLMDSDGGYVATVTAEQLFQEVEKAKTNITNRFDQDKRVSKEGNLIKLPIQMYDEENSGTDSSFVRKPFSNFYMSLPNDRVIFTRNNDYFLIDLTGYESIDCYSEYGELMKPRYTQYLNEDIEKGIQRNKTQPQQSESVR